MPEEENPFNLKTEVLLIKQRLLTMEKKLTNNCTKTARIEKNVWVHNGAIGLAILLLIRLLTI